MKSIFSINFTLAVFTFLINEFSTLQNVKLILPPVVQAGTAATLLCLYDLEGDTLYSVQWYRGQYEFFRFVPSENPPYKVFEIPGLTVDVETSNAYQVTLRNIPRKISGEFSCEITTDAPRFSTSCRRGNLTVVSFNLSLKAGKTHYYMGEILMANCTVTPRLPMLKMIFYINKKLVSDEFIDHPSSNSAILSLNTSIINAYNPNPTIIDLKCTGLLNDMFYEISRTISLQLGSFTSDTSKTSTVKYDHKKSFLAKIVFLVLLIRYVILS